MPTTEPCTSIQKCIDLIAPCVQRLARRYVELCNTPLIGEDDLTQEGLIAAWKGFSGDSWNESKSSMSRPSLWAFIKHKVNWSMLDYVRKHGVLSKHRLAKLRQGESVPQTQKLTPSIEKSIAVAYEDSGDTESTMTDDLIAIVQTLSPDIKPRDMEILIERFVEDKNYQEIAKRHSLTHQRVQKLCTRQLDIIRDNARQAGMDTVESVQKQMADC